MIWSDFILYNRLDASLDYRSIEEYWIVSSLRALRLCVRLEWINISAYKQIHNPQNASVDSEIAQIGWSNVCFLCANEQILYDDACFLCDDVQIL